MILFDEDLYKYGVTLHTESKNLSFLKTHVLLKKMGVQNNKFFLGITQPDLAKYDPHNLKDTSEELAARIAYECKINMWYYFREVVRIPAAGTMPIPFLLNRANLALIWLFYNNIDVFLVIPRQTGKTMSTQAIVSHLMYILCYNFNFAMLTKDNTLLQENVNRLKEIRNGLPQYLLDNNKLLDTERKEGLSYYRLKNQYQTFVAQSDHHGAEKLGRGMSTPAQHWDEMAFFKNAEISYPAAVNATNAAAEQAKAAGLPHTNILTTTAGRTDSPEGKFARTIIDRCMLFSESLYDCKNREELGVRVQENSTNNMIYAVFSYLQLGKTHEWFREKSVRSGGSQDDIDRDYLNIWKSGVATSVVSTVILKRIMDSIKDPIHTSLNGGYLFRWYVHPEVAFSTIKPMNIIIGLDTSENIGRDFTSICMINAADMRVICTARCNESDLVKLAVFIAQFLIDHPNSILVPERKSTASVMLSLICAKLRKAGINPLRRIFNMVAQFRDEKPYNEISYVEAIEEGPGKKYIGFTTAGSGATSRDALYKTTLMKTLESNADRIHDQVLSEEISLLSMKNGRIDHATGKHDDMLIAYLLAAWFVYFGRNLHLYDVIPGAFLSLVANDGSLVAEDVKKANDDMRARIEDIERLLRQTSNECVRQVLRRELNHYESFRPTDDAEQEFRRAEDIRTEGGAVKFSPETIRQYLSVLNN